MKSKLIQTASLLKSKSKKPWACFETDGISSNGLGVNMHWNKAFINHLHGLGIQGINEEETMRLFFLFLSNKVSDSFSEDDSTVNSEVNPTLSSDTNILVK